VVAGPFLQGAGPQEIAVVGQEFFETGTGDVSQLDLGFFRGAGGLAGL